MTIYVDDAHTKSTDGGVCHLIADSEDELQRMAATLGAPVVADPQCARQKCLLLACAKRSIAVNLGAVEVSTRQLAAMAMRRMVTGVLGSPADAYAWFECCRRDMKDRLFSARTDQPSCQPAPLK